MPGGRVAMQRERPLVRPPQLRAFPVHAVPLEARRPVEAVALIGPPAVDADIDERLVIRPVARHLAIVRPLVVSALRPLGSGGAVHGSGTVPVKPSPFDHDVQHDLEVLRVQLVDHLLRIGEVRPASR